ncbi:YraN family protein [Corynebacterium sp.]|uniref:YraN family protein n=1 Tax=Corynebacterium sp. TaxID=1720 RepID=UPI0026DC598F|nr:YraN family protein [Corynebacterium sp.]MDO5032504.1 YraN family protein [Corynebacterium sp.]
MRTSQEQSQISGALGHRVRHKDALGKRGEAFAAEFYRARGAQVIAANVRYQVGEIDLIVREPEGTIVFVEVKTRASAQYGVAEAVTPRKLARMRKAAVQWLEGKPLSTVRFDVLALVARGKGQVQPSTNPGSEFDMEYYQGVDHGAW